MKSFIPIVSQQTNFSYFSTDFISETRLILSVQNLFPNSKIKLPVVNQWNLSYSRNSNVRIPPGFENPRNTNDPIVGINFPTNAKIGYRCRGKRIYVKDPNPNHFYVWTEMKGTYDPDTGIWKMYKRYKPGVEYYVKFFNVHG